MVAAKEDQPREPEMGSLWTLSFVRGYLELGMLEKAEKELARLPLEDQHRPESLSLAGQILMARRQWEAAIEVFAIGRALHPGCVDFYVKAAYAYEQVGRLQESRNMWQLVPRPVGRSGFAHLNLARCEAKLGNLPAARRHITTALHLDPNIRALLDNDPGLVQLLNTPGQSN
ncbi:MAG: tetratricopeptide repeat protein [Opitutaceae bacterium]